MFQRDVTESEPSGQEYDAAVSMDEEDDPISKMTLA